MVVQRQDSLVRGLDAPADEVVVVSPVSVPWAQWQKGDPQSQCQNRDSNPEPDRPRLRNAGLPGALAGVTWLDSLAPMPCARTLSYIATMLSFATRARRS